MVNIIWHTILVRVKNMFMVQFISNIPTYHLSYFVLKCTLLNQFSFLFLIMAYSNIYYNYFNFILVKIQNKLIFKEHMVLKTVGNVSSLCYKIIYHIIL